MLPGRTGRRPSRPRRWATAPRIVRPARRPTPDRAGRRTPRRRTAPPARRWPGARCSTGQSVASRHLARHHQSLLHGLGGQRRHRRPRAPGFSDRTRRMDCPTASFRPTSTRCRWWSAASGAIFNLRCNALRPAGWTSADAAGLPILPGLVRRDEVETGRIDHALRFTVAQTSAWIRQPGHA